MRKYQQLLLLIVSIFCFISFLFYRHEYLKLRSVLSVLNFFGSLPATNSSCVVLSHDYKNDPVRKYNYLEPRSSWTKFDQHFIYSSFWESAVNGGYVRTMAIGPISSFSNHQCRVWFEKNDIILSEPGRFKYDLDVKSISIKEKNTWRKYFLKCYVDNEPDRGTPYGVLWMSPSESSNVFSSVFMKKIAADEPVICVKPDYSGLPKTSLIEFISFYNKIGISNFIIYDSGIQHTLFPFLETITSHDEIFQSLTVLPWNFPETDTRLESLSLKDDCLSRTFGVAKLIVIVAWNEYIFPTNADINSLRRNLETDFISLSFDTWLCCTDFRNDQSSKDYWPEFLRKTRCVQSATEETAFLNSKSYVKVRKNMNYGMPSKIVSKRLYDNCDKLPDKSTVLPLPAKYADVGSHKLLQMWKSYLNASAIFN